MEGLDDFWPTEQGNPTEFAFFQTQLARIGPYPEIVFMQDGETMLEYESRLVEMADLMKSSMMYRDIIEANRLHGKLISGLISVF